jgi:hypothetical protein
MAEFANARNQFRGWKFKSQGCNTLSEIPVNESVRAAIAFSWQSFCVDFPNYKIMGCAISS